MKFKTPLVPLHSHSTGSMLDGASTPQQYVDHCCNHGIPAISLTEHGTMSSAHELFTYAKEKGIQGIVGCELYVDLSPEYKYGHLTVWALTEEGYKILSTISSKAYNNSISYFGDSKPRVTWSQLEQADLKGHLAVGTGCIVSVVNRPFKDGNKVLAIKNLERLIDIFGKDNVYAELMFHEVTHDYDRKTKDFVRNPCTDVAPDGDPQNSCNRFIYEMSEKYKLTRIVTDDAHFVNASDKILQDCLLKQGEENGWHFYNSYHLQTPEEAFAIAKHKMNFKESQFEELLSNNFSIIDKSRNFRLPHSLVMPPINIDPNKSPDEQYFNLCKQRIVEIGRETNDPKYEQRLNSELKVIASNGKINFLPYFLFLSDIIKKAKEKRIVVGPCRGSAGGSLLSYYMGITHIDPVKHNLPFERFLSIDRINRDKFPDIDVDFDASRRHEIINDLKTEYGDRCAQIGTHSTIGLKQAIQDASRAIHGEVLKEVYALNKGLKSAPQGMSTRLWLYGGVDKEGNAVEAYLDQNTQLKQFFEMRPQIKDLVHRLVGLTRQMGRHAGGFCFAPNPIYTYIPTAIVGTKDDKTHATQYTKDWVEKSGLIKMDLLGVNTLSDIGKCLDILNKQGIELDIYNLPELPEVFEQYHQGDTITIFQMEPGTTCHYDARSQRSWLKDMKPQSVADLSVITALVRPGALDAIIEDGFTTAAAAYVNRKNGQPFEYLHTDLEPILKDTFGVMVYQEQVTQIFIDLAGYSAEKADYVREGIGKKKKEIIEEANRNLESALKSKTGWTEHKIGVLCQQIQAFAKYAFNKSHSYGYASLSYISAYLKKMHTMEWWTAVLSNAEKEEIYNDLWPYVKDFVRLPNVNYKNTNFELIDGKIQAPLRLIHGIGPAAYENIVTNAPYITFDDFLKRTSTRAVKMDTVSALAYADAFPFTEGSTSQEIIKLYCELRDKDFPKELEKVNEIDLYLLKKQALSILDLNYIKFIDKDLTKDGFILPKSNRDDIGMDYIKEGDKRAMLFSKAEGLKRVIEKYPLLNSDVYGAGIIEKKTPFTYKSKSNGESVTSTKYHVTMRDRTVTLIFWRSTLDLPIGSLILFNTRVEYMAANEYDFVSISNPKYKLFFDKKRGKNVEKS